MEPIRRGLRQDYSGRLELDFFDIGSDPAAGDYFRVEVVPTLIYLDAQGRELGRHEGFASRETIVETLDRLGML